MTNRVLEREADRSYLKGENGAKVTKFIDLDERHWAYYDVMEAANAHDYRMEDNRELWVNLKTV